MILAESIRQELIREILEGRYAPGDRMPTELELSARFHASRVTVRRAYGALEEARIIIRRKRAGTILNNHFSAATDPIRSVGALVPFGSAFPREFLETFCLETAKRDALTVLDPGDSGERQNAAALRLAGRGIKNLVLWGVDRTLDLSLFRRLRVLGVNLVFFDRIVPGAEADYVGLDNFDAVAQLFGAAREAGFRRFCFLDADTLEIDSNRERAEAFRRLTAEAGLPGEVRRVAWQEAQNGAFSQTPIPTAEPCAILCANDTIALAARSVTGAKQRLFSIDGTPAARLAGIVSCRQPIVKMARACWQVLEEQRRKGAEWQAAEYRFKGELQRAE